MSATEQTPAEPPRPTRPLPERARRRRRIVAILAALALAAGGGVVTAIVSTGPGSDDGIRVAAEVGPTASPVPTVTASPSSTPLVTASPSPTRSPSASPRAGGGRAPKPGGPARSTSKKGVSTYQFAGNQQALRDVGASWYYNWSPTKATTGADPGVEFVPMIWGPANVNAATLKQVKTQGTALLGFNEPDFASQSNMTVQQALDLWPQLMATGMRLGSPAPAVDAAKAGGWLDQFLTGAASRGYRVDFITVHWYGGDFSAAAVNQLRGYLQAIWNRYHKPIWLTEYALMRFANGGVTVPTQQEQVAFVNGSTAMLASLSFVERYAWFSLPAKEANSTGLYRTGTTTTEVGAAYRAAG